MWYLETNTPEASQIARLAAEYERTLATHAPTTPQYEAEWLRLRLHQQFLTAMQTRANDSDRTMLVAQACIAIVGNTDTENSDQTFGPPESLIVRIACLHKMTEAAQRCGMLRTFEWPVACLAQKYLDEMAVEAKKRARDCYLSLHTLPNRLQAALVMLDPEVELLLPMADPRRQALYAATSS